MKTEELSQIERRVKSYWYTDGLGELIGGALFILLGIFFFLQSFFGKDSILTNWLQASLAVLVISGVFASRWVINHLKIRLTYPRTGFVEYRVDQQDLGRRRIVVITLGGAAAVVFVALAKLIGSTNWIPAATGLIVAFFLFIIQGRAAGLQRFNILGAVSIAVGISLSFSGLSEGYALGSYYGLLGLAFVISGGIVLRHYLQDNPFPVDTGHER